MLVIVEMNEHVSGVLFQYHFNCLIDSTILSCMYGNRIKHKCLKLINIKNGIIIYYLEGFTIHYFTSHIDIYFFLFSSLSIH